MKRIVLAEGNQDTRFILDRVLHAAGYQVESLTEGIKIIDGKIGLPDVFVLDQELQVIDGFAISKFLRIKKETRKIPIIMLSPNPELQTKARKIGVTDFLQKPFTTKHLLTVIEKHVNKASDNSTRKSL